MSKEAKILTGVLVLVVGGMIGLFALANAGAPATTSTAALGDKFASYASSLGIDGAKVKQAVNDAAAKDFIEKDIADGTALKVDSTPTFYLNGEKLSSAPVDGQSAYSYDNLKKQIETALAATPNAGPAELVRDDSHKLGSGTVRLIEFGDFQCPACGAVEPTIERLRSEYDGRVEFVFRNYPLTQIHKNAMAAAEAAEAAGAQGKYWEMHDLLYKNQNEWSNL